LCNTDKKTAFQRFARGGRLNTATRGATGGIIGIGIGGGFGPFRAGISTRGFGIGVGPLSATGGWRRRRSGGGGGGEPVTLGTVVLTLIIVGIVVLVHHNAENAPEPAPTTDIFHRVAAPATPGLPATYSGRGEADIKHLPRGAAVVQLTCVRCNTDEGIDVIARAYDAHLVAGDEIDTGLGLVGGNGAAAGLNVDGDDDARWTVRIWKPEAILTTVAPGDSLRGDTRNGRTRLFAVAAGTRQVNLSGSGMTVPSATVYQHGVRRYVSWDRAAHFSVDGAAIIEVGDSAGIQGPWRATAR